MRVALFFTLFAMFLWPKYILIIVGIFFYGSLLVGLNRQDI